MRNTLFISVLVAILCIALLAAAQEKDKDKAPEPAPPQQGGDFATFNPSAKKLPADVILVKGAVPSATDSVTPLPESGTITERVYTNKYFGISYPLPPGYVQKYAGPPPSDSGYYVLTQIEPSPEFKAASAGSILLSAQDMFFNLTPANNALDLVKFKRSRLSADYKLERPPTEVKIANRTFLRMDYMSPIAELHWYTLATEVRCHTVEFMLTSRDAGLLESLVRNMEKMQLTEDAAPSGGRGGGSSPVCIKDFATAENVRHKVEPVLTDRKFNPIPVRIIIDKQGRVKHVHVISAFPDQSKAVTDALLQWEFKPYRVNGEPVEVETGITFGAARQRRPQTNSASVAD